MGTIIINKLRMMGRHGVLPQERKVGNIFEVNLRLDVPGADRAMKSDNLADTVNYADIVELVKREMSHPCHLIEAVAGRIIRAIESQYAQEVAGGEVTVSKLAPPMPAELDSVGCSFTFGSWK